MKKSRKLIIVIAVVAIVILTTIGTGYFYLRDKTVTKGFFLSAANGTPMLINEHGSACVLSSDTIDFSEYESGDRIIVISGLILETYPSQTDAHHIFKTADGEFSDIPENSLESLRELGWID